MDFYRTDALKSYFVQDFQQIRERNKKTKQNFPKTIREYKDIFMQTFREKAKNCVEKKTFQRFIMGVIVVNSIILGIQTASLSAETAAALTWMDSICVVIYVVEAILKLAAYRWAYFRDNWNIFDFTIVVLCLIPTSMLPIPVQVTRIIRAFRAFRAFRLVSSFRQMRVIVEAIVKALPGVLWTASLLLIFFYIFAVIGVTMFGQSCPEYFGNLGRAGYTLFQIMTLESWSHGIARPVMTHHPLAWMYFVPFVVISTFVMLNIVVGVVVNSIGQSQDELDGQEDNVDNPVVKLEGEVKALGEQLIRIEELLREQRKD